MSDFEKLRDVGDELERSLLESGFDTDEENARELRTLAALGLAAPTSVGAEGIGEAATTGAASSSGASVGKWLALALASGGVIALAVGLRTESEPALAPGSAEPASIASSSPVELPAPPPPPLVVELPEPVPEPSAPRPTVRQLPKASPTAAPAPVDPSALRREIAALDRVRAALRAGQISRANSELQRYEREFPFGALGPEAQALRARIDDASKK